MAGGSDGKESACKADNADSIPGLGTLQRYNQQSLDCGELQQCFSNFNVIMLKCKF